MSNVNIDWSKLGFEYQPIAQRYVANFKDGKWGKGGLTGDANVVLNECAGILQYCQEVFEGLKAYKTKDGRTVTFRPDQNAKRMIDSAKRLEMLRSLKKCSWKPWTKWSGPTKTTFLLLKAAAPVPAPLPVCHRPVIGVKPSAEYQFRLFGTPVGNYFKNGVKPSPSAYPISTVRHPGAPATSKPA